MISPCKNCERREVGCHSNCTEYLEWKEDKIKEQDYQREMRERAYYCIIGHDNPIKYSFSKKWGK